MIAINIRGWVALLIARFRDTPASRQRLRDAAFNAEIFELERLRERLEMRADQMTARAVEALNEEGLDHYDGGDYWAAIMAFRDAVAEDPSDYQALRGLAVSHHDSGELNDATYYYYSVLRVAPDDLDMLWNLGLALTEADREQEALDVFNRAAELAPDDPVVLAALGDAYNKWGHVPAAVDCWKHSLELDPTNPEANLAMSAADESIDPETAISYANTALDEFTDRGDVGGQVISLANIAWGLFLLGRHEDAEEMNQRALALDNEVAQIWFNMGINRLVAGDVSGATDAYDKALEVTGLTDLKIHGIDDLQDLSEQDDRFQVSVLLERLREEYSDRRREVTTAG